MTEHPTDAMKPCPHCNETDVFTERADFSSSYVVCNGCGARGPTMCQEDDDEEEPGQAAAIKRWNTRSQDTVGHAWERALRERLTAAESEGRTMVPITTLELRGLIAARTTPIDDEGLGCASCGKPMSRDCGQCQKDWAS